MGEKAIVADVIGDVSYLVLLEDGVPVIREAPTSMVYAALGVKDGDNLDKVILKSLMVTRESTYNFTFMRRSDD